MRGMMDPVGIAQRIRWMLLYRQRVVMQVFRGRQQMFRHLDHLVLPGMWAGRARPQ